MAKSKSEKIALDLERQLTAEKLAHTLTINTLHQQIARLWRLIPTHYINLMGVYPSMRKLLLVLSEAADLQDPSRSAPIEDTMRTEFVSVGENASTSSTERAVLTHRQHRATVVEMNRQLDWMAHKLSKMIPGVEDEYDPPSGNCPECGAFVFRSDTGRPRTYCSARCRQRAATKRDETQITKSAQGR